jgi:hypothetical protein
MMMSHKETTYPWLRLLELEFGEETKPVKRKRPGRPRKPFPRKRVRVSLTEDETAALDELLDLLAERMGRPIHRGHLVSFLTFRLRNSLQHGDKILLPEDIHSFVDLARYLDSKGR